MRAPCPVLAAPLLPVLSACPDSDDPERATADGPPAAPPSPSTADATRTGESESISFTASEAGDFALACLIPAHAATGMWMGFEVSASGETGLRR